VSGSGWAGHGGRVREVEKNVWGQQGTHTLQRYPTPCRQHSQARLQGHRGRGHGLTRRQGRRPTPGVAPRRQLSDHGRQPAQKWWGRVRLLHLLPTPVHPGQHHARNLAGCQATMTGGPAQCARSHHYPALPLHRPRARDEDGAARGHSSRHCFQVCPEIVGHPGFQRRRGGHTVKVVKGGWIQCVAGRQPGRPGGRLDGRD